MLWDRRDVTAMAAQPPEQCATCRYFRKEYAPASPGAPCDSGEPTCDAFPGGIPWPIREGESDHTMPYTGDHGIQYVANPKLIGGLIKIADPEKGISDEEIKAIFAALGLEPSPKETPPAE